MWVAVRYFNTSNSSYEPLIEPSRVSVRLTQTASSTEATMGNQMGCCVGAVLAVNILQRLRASWTLTLLLDLWTLSCILSS